MSVRERRERERERDERDIELKGTQLLKAKLCRSRNGEGASVKRKEQGE